MASRVLKVDKEERQLAELKREHERLTRESEVARLQKEIAAIARAKENDSMWDLPSPLPDPYGENESVYIGCMLPRGCGFRWCAG
jgi:hypothetical protein